MPITSGLQGTFRIQQICVFFLFFFPHGFLQIVLEWNQIESNHIIALPEKILLSVLCKTLKSLLGPKGVYLFIWLLFITPRTATRISILNYLGCRDLVISALPLLKVVKQLSSHLQNQNTKNVLTDSYSWKIISIKVLVKSVSYLNEIYCLCSYSTSILASFLFFSGVEG